MPSVHSGRAVGHKPSSYLNQLLKEQHHDTSGIHILKTRSAKAKGKKLEKWIASKLLSIYPELTEEDIRTPVGAQSGPDIILSKKAKELCPYSFEAKNREVFKSLYSFVNQARVNGPDLEPVVIIKMNRENPMVLIDAEWFFKKVRNG